MTLRIGLFLFVFTLFYWWLNISWVTPITLLQYQRGLYWNLRDYLLWMIVALIPYAALLKYYPRRKGRGFLLIAVLLVLAHYLRLITVYGYGFPLTAYLIKNAHLFFAIPIFSFIFYFIRYGQSRQMRQAQILTSTRHSELEFLRLQINPHFLFNSLNNIYGLVYENSPKARDAVRSLSELMRYSYQDLNKDVLLNSEVLCMRQYISLQELRYATGVNILLETKGPLDTVLLPPMLLIPFVENAFKHGDFSNGKLVINVQTDGSQIYFYCSNPKKMGSPKKIKGIGLQNTRRRLDLLYGRHHALSITDSPTQFTVHLTMNHEAN